MKTITIGLLLVLLSISGAIAYGASGQSFINIPSAAIIVLTAGGLTLMRYRKGESLVNILASAKKILSSQRCYRLHDSNAPDVIQYRL